MHFSLCSIHSGREATNSSWGMVWMTPSHLFSKLSRDGDRPASFDFIFGKRKKSAGARSL